MVVGKAYSNTKAIFADKIRDAIFGALLGVLGVVLSWRWHGWPVVMEQSISFVLTAFGPLGFTVAIVFLWNLWIAPAELAYEAFKSTVSSTASQKTPINWAPWQQMPKLSILQFGKILAHNDPTSKEETSEAAAYRQLIWMAINSQELPYILRKLRRIDGKLVDEQLCIESQISRDEAIQWAKNRNLDVNHIERPTNPPS